jgi:hypothetical protein
MEEFDEILQRATAAIGRSYFLLPVHGLQSPVRRERVYCYELYHQMRCQWPREDRCRYALNGEVDKQKHPYFREDDPELEEKFPKPDLLVHVPGERDNYAVIEVKSARLDRDEVGKDISTLLRFLEVEYPYRARDLSDLWARPGGSGRTRRGTCRGPGSARANRTLGSPGRRSARHQSGMAATRRRGKAASGKDKDAKAMSAMQIVGGQARHSRACRAKPFRRGKTTGAI